MRSGSLLLLIVTAAACGGGGSRPTATNPPHPPPDRGSAAEPVTAAPLTAPGLRLPGDFAVGSYAATLTIDPAQPTFTGAIEISGALASPQAVIWLHAEHLDLDSAVAETASQSYPLEAVTGVAPGRVALRASTPIPAGNLVIAIRYRGQLDPLDTAGTFRQQVDGDWYAFTQHESIYARRTFPCVDEPGSKVPWTLTLVVPSALTAVANAPAVTDTVEGSTRTVRFAATPPLPSYLIAFGVGPFDVVPAGTSSHGTPLRIIALKGRGADAAFAVSSTPKILDELERWFGTPYPYAKLDSMAIPATVGFGAMENAGLITYRESLILMPADASLARQRRYAGVAAHEIAHQWFGDLVTPAWWDDIWLNESFASWLPDKIIAKVFPSWWQPTDQVEQRAGALDADSLITARRIRQPIETEDDILTAFDGITYGKGASVLRMFEAQVGAAPFQAGVRAYLAAHANGNATAADFVAAIAAQAHDLDVTGGFGSFLDQAGAPRIAATLTCADGKGQVRLSQRRFVPLGAPAPTTAPTWTVPLCVKAGSGRDSASACGQLTGGEVVIELPRCATWVWPNTDGTGYYRSGLDAAQWRALITEGWAALDDRERLTAAGDLMAAVSAGDASVDLALDLVPKLVAARSRPFVSIALEAVENVRPWVPALDRPRFARWVKRTLGPRVKGLGFLPRAGETLDEQRVRAEVVPVVADVGEDARLRKAAAMLVTRWRTLPDDVRGMVLWIAVRANPSLHAGLLAEFRTETDRVLRGDLARALGAVPESTALGNALALLLDPAIDIRDSQNILWTAIGRDDTRGLARVFVTEHADDLIARLPPQSAAGLVNAITSRCDDSDAAGLRDFATDKFGQLPGARRRIDQAFERMAQCAAEKAATAPALTAWLRTLK